MAKPSVVPIYSLPVSRELTSRLVAIVLSQDAEFIAKAGKNFTKILEEFRDYDKNKSEIKKVNKRIARAMQQGVIEGYKLTVERGGLAPTSYRRGDPQRKYAGKLLYVIKRSNFVVGTENGIDFVNVSELNNTARHWRRLNFGAGPNEGYQGVKFDTPKASIRFGSGQRIDITPVEGAPRANFSVPRKGYGYFDSEGHFYMLRSDNGYGIVSAKGTIVNTDGKRKQVRVSRSPTSGQFQTTRGIRRIKSEPSKHGIGARHFLDYGLVALGKEFGPQYTEYFKERTAKIAAKGKEKKRLTAQSKLRIPGLTGNKFYSKRTTEI